MKQENSVTHSETQQTLSLYSHLDSAQASESTGSRRGFMAGSLATGFAAAVVPTGELLAQVVTTSAEGLTAGEVKITVDGVDVPAYRAMPAGKTNCPVVLVVQEIFGVHEYIKDTCRRFAKLGYMAIGVELYFRQGDPTKYTAIPELFANVVSKVPDAQVMKDLDATAAWAGKNGGDTSKLAITGFCWGGRITWLYTAHNKNVKAGVAWYGRLSDNVTANNPKHPFDIAESLNGPVLGLYGGKDTGIPLANVDEMKTRLSFGNAASKASDIFVYPEAPHAFHADYRPSYRKEAAEDGWTKCIAWFKKNGVA
jgi:carboxymethylenebutenolidase